MDKLDCVGAWSVILRAAIDKTGKLFGTTVLPIGFHISKQEVMHLLLVKGATSSEGMEEAGWSWEVNGEG